MYQVVTPYVRLFVSFCRLLPLRLFLRRVLVTRRGDAAQFGTGQKFENSLERISVPVGAQHETDVWSISPVKAPRRRRAKDVGCFKKSE
jgi:hypothetical protein